MVVILDNLSPFLLVDRGYEVAATEVRATVPFQGQGSGAVIRSLNRLMALGWEMPEDFATQLKEREPEAEAVSA
jgi:hypothetical protein